MLHSFCLAQNNSGFKSKNTTVVKTSEQSQAVAKYNDVIHDNQVQDTTFKFGSYKIKGDKKLHGKAKREVKKGDYYFSLGPGKYSKAMTHYKKAFMENPNHAYIDYKIGMCYLLMKSKKYKAIMYLDKAYNQDKHVSQDIHYYLGVAHQLSEDYERAIEEYKKSKREYKKAHQHDHISDEERKDHMDLVNKHISECEHAEIGRAHV